MCFCLRGTVLHRASFRDTSEDGEMSDHDLTPCNASPSLTHLLSWTDANKENRDEGRPGGQFIDQDDVEEMWKERVSNLSKDQEPTNHELLQAIAAFAKLFNVRPGHAVTTVQDSSRG